MLVVNIRGRKWASVIYSMYLIDQVDLGVVQLTAKQTKSISD